MSTIQAPPAARPPESEGAHGMTLHLADFDFDLPLGRLTFEEFRRWTLSDSFPERGRFDFLRGRVEADVSPESLCTHNKPKGALYATVRLAERRDLGEVYADRARVVVEAVELSCEPDLVFVSNESFDSGRVRLTPRDDRPDDSVEIVGPPDLVAEVVSNTSVRKDNRSLYSLYYEAGVLEYWLVDVRGKEIVFRPLARGESGWEEVTVDADGYFLSPVLGRRYRLERHTGRRGEWRYDLVERDPS